MSASTAPVEEAESAQGAGSDPERSVFVAASAGSGKTKVLRDRVLRLMLEGKVHPRRILCLTFTKAAAAEMANRIQGTLARWSSIPDEELREDIQVLTGTAMIEDAMLAEARRLFVRVLDAPGGMRIHTIHAFCQSLLRRFPLEAAIAPHFSVIEDRDAKELMDQAWRAMLGAAHSGSRPDIARALETAAGLMNEARLTGILRALLNERQHLGDLRQSLGGQEAILAEIARALGLEPAAGRAAILEGAVANDALDGAGLGRAAQAMSNRTKTDAERAGVIGTWLGQGASDRVLGIETYALVFLNKDGDIRKSLVSKGLEKKYPGIESSLLAEAQRIQALFDRLKAFENHVATSAVLALGLDLIERYEALKAVQASLDYDDLIQVARDLLSRPGIAPWVLYKLDGGIDHVLIDEAQDTSPEQWRVIVDLTAEFFAGRGASESRRTLFAVGDPKQSIFSFQGADPAEFRRLVARLRAQDPANFDEVSLDVSFRSSPSVLEVVDRVFAGSARDGVVTGDAPMRHLCHREGRFGQVSLWPLAVPVAAPEPEPWSIPAIVDLQGLPVARLAERVAEEISGLIGKATTGHQDQARLLHAGDFLVLVRNRTSFVDLLVRALKFRGVPVAGADRMHLLGQIAVMDLMALARFVLLPEDDLSLAEVLRSPLVGLSEEELYVLCRERPGGLWPRLQEMAGVHPWARQAADFLKRMIALDRRATPHEFFTGLLGREGGRRRLYARLGPQCGEAIDEFLGLALAHEQSHAPTLQNFLAWLEGGDMVVKRDLDAPAGQVRIMTVHGAKGLQAPVVFLCDQRRTGKAPIGLFWVETGGQFLPLWSPNAKGDGKIAAALRAASQAGETEEENRLLYVAMTRAEERLIVCGWSGAKASNDKSWHDHVGDALLSLREAGANVRAADFRLGEGWKGEALELTGGAMPTPVGEREEEAETFTRPDWLDRSAPSAVAGTLALSPSRLDVDQGALLSPLGDDDGWRFKRGLLIHHLLELLPGLEPDQRASAALAYLAAPLNELDPDAGKEILDEVLAVIDNPSFQRIFGRGSMAEVPIVARWQDDDGFQRVLSGRIDRLWVGETEAWAVDFKSNRPPPLHVAHVRVEYRQQMAAYGRALQDLYPDKAIRCFLLWSDGPSLMELPPDMLGLHDSSAAP